ncbi:DNA repair protein RecO [Methylocystis hirsuta]|uniref:DNA repair protein RecO n=1 Tax=Methylocystis hirsuta TaxID=369798 RepID=A0A3M9XRZ7_9HYPH|nr:DNA repair protein RecO [Methylocystis hirsuta]RNJ50814.1 DNA repair protein RecO [Methylocystis hirsuta]
MEWRDDALILGARRHGETSVILEVMTRGHGRHLGLVRGGRSRRLRPILQPGNLVAAQWRARLEDHLGALTVEPLSARAAYFLDRAAALHGVVSLCALLRLLPERDPHEELFEMADAIAALFGDIRAAEGAATMLARFELALLGALGFGLDLNACALTGAQDDLAYVSPKSGRAVSRAAGAPWRDKLLPYPDFLQHESSVAEQADLIAAFRLTGYFLTRDVLKPRGVALPAARELYVGALLRVA